jgi:hypothetical protein
MVDTWQIIVDDVHDIADVETTSGDGGSDEDRTFACTEGSARTGQSCHVEGVLGNSQCIFTFALSAVRVDRGRGHAEIVQIVVEKVSRLLGCNKDQGARRRHGQEQVVYSLLLHIALDPDNLRAIVSEPRGTVLQHRSLSASRSCESTRLLK